MVPLHHIVEGKTVEGASAKLYVMVDAAHEVQPGIRGDDGIIHMTDAVIRPGM